MLVVYLINNASFVTILTPKLNATVLTGCLPASILLTASANGVTSHSSARWHLQHHQSTQFPWPPWTQLCNLKQKSWLAASFIHPPRSPLVWMKSQPRRENNIYVSCALPFCQFDCSTYSVFFDPLSLRGFECHFAARSDSCWLN